MTAFATASEADAHDRVTAWAQACSAELSAVAAQSTDETNNAKAHLAQLRKRLDVSAAALQRERELSALRLKISEARSAVDALRQEVAAKESEVLAKHQLDADAEAHRLRAAELRRGTAPQRDLAAFCHLGLDFDGTGDGALQLRFRGVDSREPAREFFADVDVDSRDEYALRSTYPTLAPAAARRLVDGVNSSNNFGRFVRGLRAEFRAALAA
ncbi:hypothetical protein M885DRAFT_616150 [Pelagophyceae sp. CCMP2097]|nr:hypothetical protein M885DRAFT_616150 [Pelagophyceae sp. CCMP2097]